MRSLNDMLKESIFDVDNNIDAVGYEVTHCGKRGIKTIAISVFDTNYNTIDDSILKTIVFPNFTKEFDVGVDTKLFDKHIKILDRNAFTEAKLNSNSKEKLYNIIERVYEELDSTIEKYGDSIGSSTGVRHSMQDWLSKFIKGNNCQFRNWTKSGTIQISFTPRRGSYIVRIYASIRDIV